jgi:hypothetical protein
VDFTGDGVVAAGPAAVFAVLADLGTYPDWLGIVHRAERDERDDGADPPAWLVDIGARLGPVRRAKRLRMVRVHCDGTAGTVRFERDEGDCRSHSPWVLTARAEAAPAGTRVTMALHYGGRVPLPGLERILALEVRRALPRLEKRTDADVM